MIVTFGVYILTGSHWYPFWDGKTFLLYVSLSGFLDVCVVDVVVRGFDSEPCSVETFSQ